MNNTPFANGGAVPLASGFGAQQMPVQSHRSHHHHHHRHHKNKHGAGESPLSRDESIHKVDHGHHHFHQNDGAAFGAGYGVPYGASGFYQQQQAYPGGNVGFGNQYQGNGFDQGQYAGGVVASKGKHNRRHHRHHHQNNEATAAAANDQPQGAPEHAVKQRSSTPSGSEVPLPGAAPPQGEQATHSSSGRGHQSRQTQGHTRAEADGYGHINEDLIFIERGEHSPHRQQAPAGYEYKGKIEVQGADHESRSKSHSHGRADIATAQRPVQVSQGNQPTIGSVAAGLCQPGWNAMIVTAVPGFQCPPGAPCPPGGAMYTGQMHMPTGVPQTGGMIFGGGAVGTFGAAASGGGLANLAASLPIPPQGQLVADYIVESSADGKGGADFGATPGGATTSVATGFEGAAHEHHSHHHHHESEHTEEHVTGRATIIEVWQKKSQNKPSKEKEHAHQPHHQSHSRSRSRSRSKSHSHSPDRHHDSPFDFERFRKEILSAIERITQGGGSTGKLQWSGHDGGTQTEIRQTTDKYEPRGERSKTPTTSNGEVRVIVQPIQPVFYMPRQTETTQPGQPQETKIPFGMPPPIGPTPPSTSQPTSSGAPNVIYIPRNVYVPVIKPVFVPRERVIVRPQVIHVARPVLVDRPVPVTQRPIIIDRERPVPVPVRTAAASAGQSGGSKVVKEEYVYRDNVPVAYGGRCAEYSGGTNFGYTQTEQSHSYATGPCQEVSGGYETQGPVINVAVPNPPQQSHSAGQLNVAAASGAGRIEVLDQTVSTTWQRTDRASLASRYGGPAVDIIQKTDQAEQQMYQELRQRSSSGGVQRSHSSASFGSTSGGIVHSAGSFAANSSNGNY